MKSMYEMQYGFSCFSGFSNKSVCFLTGIYVKYYFTCTHFVMYLHTNRKFKTKYFCPCNFNFFKKKFLQCSYLISDFDDLKDLTTA